MTTLIIEGPDLSGKSTAIEKISKHFKRGLLIKNLYKPTAAGDIAIYHQYWQIIKIIDHYVNAKPLFILDRFYPSQAVYSILRGVDEMEDTDIKRLDKYCSMRGDYIYIYLNTPIEELLKRFEVRGDDYVKKNELKMIKERYDIFYDNSRLHKIRINTMDPDWLQVIENFVKEVEEHEYN